MAEIDHERKFHWNADRVRAHVLLCMLGYYVEWHMRQLLKPMLFDDEDLGLLQQARANPVAKAQRSASARRKDATKHQADGTPVHSFRTRLLDLATIAYNPRTSLYKKSNAHNA